MAYPNITRVLFANTKDEILDRYFVEELSKNDNHKRKTIHNSLIEEFVGFKVFIQRTRENSASYGEYSRSPKRANSQTSNSSRGEQQDGGRSDRSGEETGRTSESGTVTEEQYSIPENGLTPRVE